jgi:hypothetical protein
VTVALVAAAIAIVGCAQEAPADVMLVTRAGSVPGARLTLRITDDGRVSCNDKPLVNITSPQLIEARALAEDLDKAAKSHLRLAPRPQIVFSYAVKLPDGTLRFSDNSLHQSTAMFQVAILAHRIAQRGCRLPR